MSRAPATMTAAALAQRHAALGQSARIRTSRAHIRARLAAHPDRASAWAAVAGLIERPPPAILKMRVHTLLASAACTGGSAADWLCAFCGIGTECNVADLRRRPRARWLLLFALGCGSIPETRRRIAEACEGAA